MPTLGKQQRLGVLYAAANSRHLRHSAVLIVSALNHENWTTYLVQLTLDIPIAKLPVEPDLRPFLKHLVRVVMMAAKFRSQICARIRIPNLGDAFHGDVFHEH